MTAPYHPSPNNCRASLRGKRPSAKTPSIRGLANDIRNLFSQHINAPILTQREKAPEPIARHRFRIILTNNNPKRADPDHIAEPPSTGASHQPEHLSSRLAPTPRFSKTRPAFTCAVTESCARPLAGGHVFGWTAVGPYIQRVFIPQVTSARVPETIADGKAA